MKQTFIDKKFRQKALDTIDTANQIIEEYQAQGFVLTLRQLYYQFVARGLVVNTERSYKNLGQTINNGRLAGMIDWSAIEDRTRNLQSNLHLTSPAHAIELIRDQYNIDMWDNQEIRCEVWIEKDALLGVIDTVCEELDVAYFSCRGYVSQSETYDAGRRMRRYGQKVIMIHLGDHDPSGMDMTRDNSKRLQMFSGYNGTVEVRRIALNMDQVQEHNPPPNPTKYTDSRAQDYIAEYGDESWELDAMQPAMLQQLIRDTIDEYRDMELWDEKEDQRNEEIQTLDNIIERLQEDGDI